MPIKITQPIALTVGLLALGRDPRRASPGRNERGTTGEDGAKPHRQPHQPAVSGQRQLQRRPGRRYPERAEPPAGHPDQPERGLEPHHPHHHPGDLPVRVRAMGRSQQRTGRHSVHRVPVAGQRQRTDLGRGRHRATADQQQRPAGQRPVGLGPSFVALHLAKGDPWVYGALVNNV